MRMDMKPSLLRLMQTHHKNVTGYRLHHVLAVVHDQRPFFS